MSTFSTPQRRGRLAAIGLLASAGLVATCLPLMQAHADNTPSLDRAIAAADATLGTQIASAGKASFVRTDVQTGYKESKTAYVKYDMKYQGARVVGGEMIVVSDEYGKVHDVARVGVGEMPAKVEAKISADKAVELAKQGVAKVTKTTTPELVVFADKDKPVSAWSIVVAGWKVEEGQNQPTYQNVYVNAADGKVLLRAEWAGSADGRGYHNGNVKLENNGRDFDSTLARGLTCDSEAGGSVSMPGNGQAYDLSTACVDVEYAGEMEHRLLKDWANRDGINGRGGWMPASVGMGDVNAYWNGSSTHFGHNKAESKHLTPIDVVAHEYGHALHQYMGSPRSSEDGIGEAFGDIMGASTEAYANNPKDRPDYVVGEMVDLQGKGPIRNMYNPSLVNNDPNCFKSPDNSGEVHKMAGPINHWFYLLAEGSNPTNGNPTSPTCNRSTVKGVGVKAAAQIFLGGFSRITGDNTHSKIRSVTLAAAKELTPGNCANFNATKAAWDAVSVPAENDPTCSGSNDPGPTSSPTSDPTGDPGQGGEIAVTNDNYRDVIASSKDRPVIFVIGANWSGMTNKALPKFRSKLSADNNSWTLAYVDGALYKTAMGNFGIKGYPTIIGYSDGREMTSPARYADGSRSQDRVNSFVDDVVKNWKNQH